MEEVEEEVEEMMVGVGEAAPLVASSGKSEVRIFIFFWPGNHIGALANYRFLDQADRKGGIRPLSPDRKQMWKIWPIFHWILILCYPKHILFHCEGSKKCIFMPV